MKTFLFCAFVAFSLCVFSQKQKVDSLNRILEKAHPDSLSFTFYRSLSKAYEKDFQYPEAIKIQEKGLNKAFRENDSLQIAKAYHQLSRCYVGWDKYKVGIDYRFKALQMYEQMGDSLWVAFEYNDIGFAYVYFEDYERVIAFYKKALAYYYRHNIQEEIALTEANVGFAYNFWGKGEEANFHHQLAMEIYKELKDTSSFGKMYHGLGHAALLRQKYTMALAYIDSALFYTQNDHLFAINQSGHLIRKGQIYTQLGKFAEAHRTFAQCVPGLQERNSGRWWKNYYEALYQLYEKQANFPKALETFEKYKAVRDSFFNAKRKSDIVEIEIQNDTRQKEQALLHLKNENKLKQQEVDFQKRLFYKVLFVLLLLTFLFVVIYRQYLSTKRAYQLLVQKNKQLIERENEAQFPEKTVQEEVVKSSSINVKERKRIRLQLEQLMSEKQLYLNPELKLNQLSKKLNTNASYLSQIINTEFGKNFSSYINEFRVKEAQKCFLRGDHKTMNLDGIASQVGFKTRVTFYSAFKKSTGVSPSFFIKSLDEQKAHN